MVTLPPQYQLPIRENKPQSVVSIDTDAKALILKVAYEKALEVRATLPQTPVVNGCAVTLAGNNLQAYYLWTLIPASLGDPERFEGWQVSAWYATNWSLLRVSCQFIPADSPDYNLLMLS